MRRWLLLASSSLMPLFLLFVAWQVHVSQAGAPQEHRPRDGHDAVFTFLGHTERLRDRRSQVTWSFVAQRLEVLTNGDYLVYGLDRGEWLNAGASALQIRADRARVEQRTHDIAAQGNIVATSERGLNFRCQQAFWFEGDGKLFVPKLDAFEWRDADAKGQAAQPPTPPALVQTTRLFYWPANSRLDLPDALSATQGPDTLRAAAGSALLDRGELQLAGPATIDAALPANAVAGDMTGPRKKVVLSCGAGGVLAYDRRTGAGSASGQVSVDLPTDSARLACDEITFSGRATRVLDAKGHVLLTDPNSQLRADSGRVLALARRAEFSGQANLVQRRPEGTVTLDAPRITYLYAESVRRASAWGGVKLDTGEAKAEAPRLTADLRTQMARLSGGVALHTMPRGYAGGGDELAQAKARPVDLHAGRVEHSFAPGARWTEARESPSFKQGDREGKADRLRYEHDREILTLVGNVRLWNRGGERARCGRLTYDLRNDEMKIEQPVSAEFWLRGDTEKAR
ncbi:MAG: hypothetical protein HZB16_17425 [Armatimonadetes bacterium]|nr:hypothetical protein [Armatimonadota bacterium]